MELVTTWEDIKNNLNQLEQYHYSEDHRELEFYKGLIKRGICFIVYERNGKLSFAPSRFAGYANNNMSLHLSNQLKDGRETNPVVSSILGKEPDEDDYLEREYRDLCAEINIESNPTGPFNNKRKYWLVKYH